MKAEVKSEVKRSEAGNAGCGAGRLTDVQGTKDTGRDPLTAPCSNQDLVALRSVTYTLTDRLRHPLPSRRG